MTAVSRSRRLGMAGAWLVAEHVQMRIKRESHNPDPSLRIRGRP